MSPLIPPVEHHPTYLTLEELEAIAWEFRDQGAQVIAYGDDWVLRVKPEGKGEQTFRAHRVGGAA